MATFLHHLYVRLRMLATDAGAAVILMVAGLSTLPLWRYGLGPSERPFDAVPLWFVVSFVLWVPLVAAASSRGVLFRPANAWELVPALPIGRRARIVAEALAAILVVLAARTVGLALGLVPLYRQLPSYDLDHTVRGLLVLVPLLLSWIAVPRLQPRFFIKPVLVSAALYVALAQRAMATPWKAAAVCGVLSLLVLLLVGIEPTLRLPEMWRRRPRLRRASPGPLAQFHRDQWWGPLRELWPLLAVVLPLPWIVRFVTLQLSGDDLFATTMFRLSLVLQFLMLCLPILYPFGLLVSGRGAATSSRGYFLRAWSVLPVRPQSVVRTVYCHALVASSMVWLLLYAYVPWFALFELSIVLLAPAIVLCEAVGDRPRGLLAIGALIGCNGGVPALCAAVFDIAPASMPGWGFAAAFVIGVIGGLPPLVHLRAGGEAYGRTA